MRITVARVCAAAALAWAPAAAQSGAGAREELLRLHHLQRTAHVLGDSALLAATFADTLTEVNHGQVRLLTREAASRRFGTYFAATRFLEWEDLRPPRIEISMHGDRARVVTEKRVRTVPPAGAEEGRGSQRFAWVEWWRRWKGGWQLTTIASTERSPSGIRAPEAEAQRRAYRILSRAREAVGGADAVARVATLRFRAECEGPDGAFTTEVVSALDGRVSLVQRFRSEAFAAGIDLEGSWRGLNGARTDSLAAALATVVTAHELHLLAIAPESRYTDPVALPAEVVDGGSVDVVGLTDRLGAVVRFYYDADGGMPVGFRLVNHAGRGAREVLTLLDDWRAVGEIRLPHAIRMTHGEDLYGYRIVEASTAWIGDDAFRPGPGGG